MTFMLEKCVVKIQHLKQFECETKEMSTFFVNNLNIFVLSIWRNFGVNWLLIYINKVCNVEASGELR